MKKTARKKKEKRYRYVVKVEEVIESSTVIESDRKMPWHRLEKIAEERRIHGTLSLNGVTDVNSWCSEAYVNGQELDKDEVLKHEE